MPAEPLRSPGTVNNLPALLRAVTALLPGSARQPPPPISLGAGSRITLVHEANRADLKTREALSELLRGANVGIEGSSPPPAFGENQHLARTNLVVAASPAVHTAAQRCGARSAAPVLALSGPHPHDAPLRLTMRTAAAIWVKLPAKAPDLATHALRMAGPVSWSQHPGALEHRCRGIQVEPEAEAVLVTYDCDTDSPHTARVPGPVAVILAEHTSGQIDGHHYPFPPGRTTITRSALPLYQIQVHSARMPEAR